jgi:PadR family transcriptional regulator PadR
LCILGLLSRGELYAYDLVKLLARDKALMITEGTIYPLLSRLRQGGLLHSRLEESASGPARKYYSLTAKGKEVAAIMQSYWLDLVAGVNNLLENENGDR